MNTSCLLIDDDLDDHEFFAIALGKLDNNIRCLMADSASHALQILADRSVVPQYIFIDFNMPRMSGLDCLIDLCRLEHLKDTQKFMFSTNLSSRIISLSKELGAKDCLIKTTSMEELTRMLKSIFYS
ncbi:MAG: response regulator [Chitinophagaceae bacterium]|nr:response regulator [Chitinophagaceae bacterium]